MRTCSTWWWPHALPGPATEKTAAQGAHRAVERSLSRSLPSPDAITALSFFCSICGQASFALLSCHMYSSAMDLAQYTRQC